MSEYESTRDPTEDPMSDDSLSASVLDSEEEAVFMEEIRRQREEAAQRHRCCICGTLYTQDEGRLLWHVNPWFFCAYHIHDMQQRSFEQDYHPGTPVSEVLRNAGVLFTDEHGKNWVCICRTCQRIPNLQQGLPETVPHTTPSRSSNEEHPFDNTDIYDTHLNARLRTLDEHRRGQLEALPKETLRTCQLDNTLHILQKTHLSLLAIQKVSLALRAHPRLTLSYLRVWLEPYTPVEDRKSNV